jgi:hypothetical protein
VTLTSLLVLLVAQMLFVGLAGWVAYRIGLRAGFARGQCAGMKTTLHEVGQLLDRADDADAGGRPS